MLYNGKNINKKIDYFTKQYNLQKSLKFALKPIGDTLKNFDLRNRLQIETDLNKKSKNVKGYINEFLAVKNDEALSKPISLSCLKEYSNEYFSEERNFDKMAKMEETLRKEIAKQISSVEKLLNKPKEFISKTLPQSITDTAKLDDINELSLFTSYFTNFITVKKNMYSSEDKALTIPSRSINDNLPKFLDNVSIFKIVRNNLDKDNLVELQNNFKGIYDTKIEDMFTVDYFNFVLSQSGIETYNNVIGGYSKPSGEKVKGLNEYINLYNQKASREDKLPLMKQLYKQIGSITDSISFIPAKFTSDEELLKAVYDFYNTTDQTLNIYSYVDIIDKFKDIIMNMDRGMYNLKGIFIKNDKNVTNLSNGLLGNWSTIQNLWNDEYDKNNHPEKAKNIEKYEDKKKKAYQKNKSFSIFELQNLISTSNNEDINKKNITSYYIKEFIKLTTAVKDSYNVVKSTLTSYVITNKGLKTDNIAIAKIKSFLDSIKEVQYLLKSLFGTGKENSKDQIFYGEYLNWFNQLKTINKLYDKVRNYITAKPYSLEKIKLSFDNSTFLGGWQQSSETNYSAQLFTKDGLYYLGVMDKITKKEFKKAYNTPTDNNDTFLKINYNQIPTPGKQVQNLMIIDGETVKKNGRKNADGINTVLEELKNKYLPANINAIRKKGSFKTTSDTFNKADLTTFIEYYAQRTKEYYSQFSFVFKPYNEYKNFAEFIADINRQAYQIGYTEISKKQLFDLVSEGKLYLFEIYNKDFSNNSKGKPNLHTMYFKALFDKDNLSDIIYKLQGGAEMFYRPASIKMADRVIHPANQEIIKRSKEDFVIQKGGKYSLTEEERKDCYSILPYEVVKNKRFTKPQFSLHFSIALNCQCPDFNNINYDVRELLKKSGKTNIIGINRGERNLIYVTIINSEGKILRQENFNAISSNYKGSTYYTDYRNKLDNKEKDRKIARENWNTIEAIKNLKEGYISQVVHKICSLVTEYDAIIVMEKLNSSFKNSRAKIEKQVYQKFETMLINKLNYYVNKSISFKDYGGLYNAYQLTNKFESFEKIGNQSGFIFYVNPNYITNVDPVTGFANMLYVAYENINKAHSFIDKFDSIRYNQIEDYFEFGIDYEKFLNKKLNFKSKWTVCSYGNRIKFFRNKDKNNKQEYKTVSVTTELKNIFNNSGIDYLTGDIKDQLLNISDKTILKGFLETFKLILQIRNSNSKEDYIISPVKNNNGSFYCSKDYNCGNENVSELPKDIDSNGSYNIARKGLMLIQRINSATDVKDIKTSISKDEWFNFIQ